MRPGMLLVVVVLGYLTCPAIAAPLSKGDASRHIGEAATVCGIVASAKYEADAQSQPTLLDLDKASPNAVFTAVIYGDDRAKFGTPETFLRGKLICVTGQVSDYQGKPEIVLTDPSQLAVGTALKKN